MNLKRAFRRILLLPLVFIGLAFIPEGRCSAVELDPLQQYFGKRLGLSEYKLVYQPDGTFVEFTAKQANAKDAKWEIFPPVESGEYLDISSPWVRQHYIQLIQDRESLLGPEGPIDVKNLEAIYQPKEGAATTLPVVQMHLSHPSPQKADLASESFYYFITEQEKLYIFGANGLTFREEDLSKNFKSLEQQFSLSPRKDKAPGDYRYWPFIAVVLVCALVAVLWVYLQRRNP